MLGTKVQRGMGDLPRMMEAGDGWIAAPAITPLTTAGAGTLLAALLSSGVLHRTGPGAAYTDTTDTGANLDAAFPDLQVGECIKTLFNNDTGFAATLAAGANVTLKSAANTAIVAINTSKWLMLFKTGVGTYDMYVL